MGPEDADDESPRRPPDPLDRLWLHPSELGAMTRPARRRSRIRPGMTLLMAGVAVGGLVVLAALTFGEGSGNVTTTAPRPAADPVARAMAVAPSVVQVRVTGGAYRRIEAVCVGDGIALTSASALTGSRSIRVRGHDGKDHAATVVGRDPQTDLALLDMTSWPGTTLVANSVSSAAVGPDDAVYSVAGTQPPQPVRITGWNEMLARSDGVVASGLLRSSAISSDRAPNPGSVLVDGRGRVVGIVIGLAAPSRGDRYAVPIDVALDVARQLHETGTAVHGWVGIAGRDAPKGTQVVHVADGSPAAAAGIRDGDVIVSVGSSKAPRMAAVVAAVRQREPGDALKVSVERDGKVRTIEINVSGPTTTAATNPPVIPTAAKPTTTTAAPKSSTTVAATTTTAVPVDTSSSTGGGTPGTSTSAAPSSTASPTTVPVPAR